MNLNNASPVAPYSTWATAATTIQAAVDAAWAGDEIVVTNGLYAAGGRAVFGTMTNRVAIDKAVTVRSVNGPLVTIIEGCEAPGTRNGDTAIRCVYVGAKALLNGFTLTNGHTRTSGDWPREQCGGGAWCEPSSVITNCILTGNSAYDAGGGMYNGTLSNCLLSSNSATYGGGAYSATINNSTLMGNTALEGGGASGCTLNHCLLSSNSATSDQLLAGGGGAEYGTLNHCTLTANSAVRGFGGGANSATLNNCVLTGNLAACGGGATSGTLNNCTLTGNSAGLSGGGTDDANLNNCIVFYNSAPNYPNILSSPYYPSVSYSCSTTLEPGPGNITNAPFFVDIDAGNLRLQSNSPCVNAGQNAYATGPTDVAGRPRIDGGTVDMGAHEFQLSFDPWLLQFGLATDGTADFADPDRDGHNNWQEFRCQTVPTNWASALRMIGAADSPSGSLVSWSSVTNRTYSLERAVSLGAAHVFEVVRSNLTGSDRITSFTDTSAMGAGPFFYRVRVEQ